jgi:ABC-type Fe3+/spermidine/putrescine transport system ATPase subunit
MPDVRIVEVRKAFRDVVALEDVSLEIKDREYVSIIGPSGCGKSTLLKCLAGIIRQDSGQLFIRGREVTALPPEERHLGYMFQEIALFPHMSTWDNVGYGPRVRGESRELIRQFVGQVMEMTRLKIGAHTYPDELSGGAKQKTALARAIAAEPQLMLLDEPLGMLDAHVRGVLRYELRRLVKELGLTAIHVTHDQEEAMSISDRLVVMKAGRVVEVGSPLELYLSPKRLFTANFLGEANFITGNVKKCESGHVRVSVKDWEVDFIGPAFNEGQRLVLAARPESVILTPVVKGHDQQWTGVVRERVLLGDCIRTEVELENGMRIISEIPNLGLQSFRGTGERVRIDFGSGSIIPYEFPPQGLDTELALE